MVREHDPVGRDVELFRRHFYGPGKVGPTAKGSAGSELVEGLMVEEGDYKLVKTRFSAFFASNLHSLLTTNGIHSLVVVGKFLTSFAFLFKWVNFGEFVNYYYYFFYVF